MNRALALCIAFFVVACSRADEGTLAGYVEADLLYLAPQDAGVVLSLAAREGDRVAAGATVFTIDPARASLVAAQSAATAQGLAARVADNGALDEQIAEAAADLSLAMKSLARSKALVADGAVSREKFDQDAAAVAAAQARVDRVRAERAAMMRDWDAANAATRLAERRLEDLSVVAPAAGVIERIYRRPGEVAAAGEPVVALLAPENVKIRFFAPQALLSSLPPGARVTIACDGCPQAQGATISFVAREPQFTPPVIYSREQRDTLVFLVEARPDEPARLRPGMPVTVVRP